MKFLIVDDHPIMRMGVRQLIAGAWPDAQILEAPTCEDGCRLALAESPDAVVLDMALPDVTGTEGVARMLRAAKEAPILVLSFHAETVHASRLLKMGVAGYLPKDQAGPELVNALQRVLAGRRYVTPAMADRLVDIVGGKSDALPHEALSTQEYRVMVQMAAGRTPAQMAEQMNLSVKTIGTYRARILEKTGWKTNAELTRYCVEHGLLATH